MAKTPSNADLNNDNDIDSTSWSDLPLDVVGTILSKLPTAGDVVRATSVCTRFLEALPAIQSLSINGPHEASRIPLDDVDVCRLVLGTNRLRALKVMEIDCYFSASGTLGLFRHLRPALETLWWGPAHTKDKLAPDPSDYCEEDSGVFLHEVSSMERLEELEVYSICFPSDLRFRWSSFRRLRSFGLTNVYLKQAFLWVLFSSAKRLEALHLKDCEFGFERHVCLSIESDTLTSLTVWMTKCVRSVEIVTTTAARLEVLRVSIPFHHAPARGHANAWRLLGGPFPTLTSITFSEGAAVSAEAVDIIGGASGLRHVATGTRIGLNSQLCTGLLKLMKQRLPSITSLELDSETLTTFLSDPDGSSGLGRLEKLVLWVPLERDGKVNSEVHQLFVKILSACTLLQSLEVYVWEAEGEKDFCFDDFSRFVFQLQRRYPRVAISQYVKKDYCLGRQQL